ncbi:MAG: hypothetical protein Q8M31_20220 [Beijerinckiaceae bacterium]|nr:hypothetical protein [Beijerinckiaceae bacterium]
MQVAFIVADNLRMRFAGACCDLLFLTTGRRMKQSRWMSMVESIVNVVVGYGVAVVTQILIFPMFGLHTTLEENLQMGAVFTMVSIARSFALRRLFNAVQHRRPIRRDI